MIKTPNQVYVQNLSQISGPVCLQLFDKAEPTVEQEIFFKSFGSGKIVRYIHHRELLIEICEFNYEKGKITKIV